MFFKHALESTNKNFQNEIGVSFIIFVETKMKGETYMHYQNYTYRTGSYRKQHKRYTANRKRQEEYESLPSFLFFRLRLLICIMLFLAFVTADKYVLTKEDTAPVFQKIEKNQSYKDLIKKYKLIGE